MGVAQAGQRLTAREWEVVQLLLRSMTYQQVADALGVAYSTVRTHVHAAHVKLGVRGMGSHRMVLRLQELGYLAAPEPPPPPPGPEPEVTPAQALYLEAFARALASRHAPRAHARARAEMRHLGGTMCIERRVDAPAWRKGAEDPLGRLLAHVLG